MKKIRILSFILLIVISFSCEKNDNDFQDSSSNSIDYDFGTTVSKDFIGEIVDENNNPIQNATVSIGDLTVQSDSNGFFIINDASVKSNFAYLKVTKAGYINGSRSLVPTEGVNQVKIMLLTASIVSTINSGSSSDVVLPNGTKVAFDGNFKKSDGTTYTGAVNVIMHHLDPADDTTKDKMPGMLLASNTESQAGVLTTFGMVNVELVGSGGEKLQIVNPVSMEMPITNSQISNSPTTIPLWHFDDEKGYWIEEGIATKVGNKYVGNVSHFSWWNCDTFAQTVTLTVNIVNSNNNPLTGVGVGLIVNSTGFTSNVNPTNNNGLVSGLIPANQILTLNIYDSCQQIISTSTIGPFSTNTILPAITMTPSVASTTNIDGTLVKCDYSNVTNGYVLLRYGNQNVAATITNGAFSLTTLICNSNNSFTLEGFDFDNLQSSGQITYTFSTPTTSIGNLIACGAINEIISYKIDNNPVKYYITNIDTSYGLNQLIISVNSSTTQNEIIFFANISTVGVYDSNNFTIEGVDFGYNNLQLPNNTMVYNVTNFGAVGQYIDINFNGTFQDMNNSSVIHSVTGIVHVIRDN